MLLGAGSILWVDNSEIHRIQPESENLASFIQDNSGTGEILHFPQRWYGRRICEKRIQPDGMQEVRRVNSSEEGRESVWSEGTRVVVVSCGT
ncbi:MAG: hypothetical protein LBJ89_01720, partial [Holosporales bacterium]|nr:hypothetical protein [Holosporales bacterium]